MELYTEEAIKKLTKYSQLKEISENCLIIKNDDPERLTSFLEGSNFKFIDLYDRLIEELNETHNSFEKINAVTVIYCSKKIAVRMVEEEVYQFLRTHRNRPILSDDVIKKMYSNNIAIAGLSIGNSVALGVAIHGIGSSYNISDGDTWSLSNLNRVRESILNFGMKKSQTTADEIQELNPFINVNIFGPLDDKNIGNFLDKPNADFCIDEVDNLSIKAKLRMECKKRGTPLIMATDVGDKVILDVERYDIEEDCQYFGGRLTNNEVQMLADNKISDRAEFIEVAIKIIGSENIEDELLMKLKDPKQTTHISQLSTGAIKTGPLVAKAIRGILEGATKKSFRVIE